MAWRGNPTLINRRESAAAISSLIAIAALCVPALFRIADWPAYYHITATGGDYFARAGYAFLVICGFIINNRTDAGRYQYQFIAAFAAQSRNFQTRRYHAIATAFQRPPRAR